MQDISYIAWLRAARRLARDADAAADLLQDALEIALRADRAPLQQTGHAPWFHGVLKRHAAFIARGDIRRRTRDVHLLADDPDCQPPTTSARGARELPESLPPGARRVLILALHGLDRREIRQVLGISDTALRQRLASLRLTLGEQRLPDLAGLQGAWSEWLRQRNPPDAGLRRAALNGGAGRMPGFRFGFSDPDGNFFSLSSQLRKARQLEDGAASGGSIPGNEEGKKPC